MFLIKFLKITLAAGLLFFSTNYVRSADLTDSYLHSKPGGNSLDKKHWEKYKNDYKYKSPKIDSTENNKARNNTSFSFKGGGWLGVLAYAAIFLLLAAIIYFIARYGFAVNQQFKNKITGFDVNSEPEDINDIIIDPLLAEALKKGDYRLATRLRFLALLQLLNKKNLIAWKRDRTNLNYIQQLSKSQIQLLFRQLCFIYESVWYGDYALDLRRYQQIDEKFELILASINSKVYV